jgi:hypothetical protein
MSEDPIYQKARAEADERGEMPPVETPQPTGSLDEATVQRMIDQALQRQQQKHDAEIDQLRGQLTAARAALPATLVPEHGGGIGVDTIADTWSLYDQELARHGVHPDQRETEEQPESNETGFKSPQFQRDYASK